MIPVLETERLIMRGWRLEDAAPLADIYGDENLARFVGGRLDYGGSWRLLAAQAGHWALRGYGNWALEDRSSASFVGLCGLWEPGDWPETEIGWVLARAFHGRGYAFEAATEARRFAYAEFGRQTLVSYIRPDNAPSRRLAARLGASFESKIELRDHVTDVFRHPGPNDIN